MRAALLSSFLLAAACTGPSEETGTPQADCEGDYDVYEPGMEIRTTQGNFYLELVSATPDPPDEGVNDWLVKVTTESGSPVNGGTVTITPWMPAHGHGISPPDYSGTPTAGDGEYAIPAFDLIMPGVWEFQTLITESMMNDTVTFSFCIEG
ncbi:MAG: FixH family protein [Alphaproteobacteria bacterium]|nr:FixH family protein [Alphaproteobacteria bacterium]